MLFYAIVFFISLACVSCLFGVKYWEKENKRVLYPRYREMADEYAVKLKELALSGREELSKLPPRVLILAKRIVHESALGVARLARDTESRAHQLADLVSHKHRFEKRETRSEFLKQVGEYPISNNSGFNGADSNVSPQASNSDNGSERL